MLSNGLVKGYGLNQFLGQELIQKPYKNLTIDNTYL